MEGVHTSSTASGTWAAWVLFAGAAAFMALAALVRSVSASSSRYGSGHQMSEEEIQRLPPQAQREVRKKQKLRQRAAAAAVGTPNQRDCPVALPAGAAVLPRGQTLARSWLVLDLGTRPEKQVYDPWGRPDDWRLKVTGLQGGDRVLTLEQLKALGVRQYDNVPWHCVTGWSALGLQLEGVPLAALLQELRPREDWKGVLQVAADGYTVNVHREDMETPDAFVCTGWGGGGGVLPPEHGGIRLVLPSLFGWKSAKFLCELHFLPHHPKGFWERLGCHSRGRAMEGERWAEDAQAVWEVLSWITRLYQRFGGYHVWVLVMQNGGNALGAVASLLGVFRRQAAAAVAGGARGTAKQD